MVIRYYVSKRGRCKASSERKKKRGRPHKKRGNGWGGGGNGDMKKKLPSRKGICVFFKGLFLFHLVRGKRGTNCFTAEKGKRGKSSRRSGCGLAGPVSSEKKRG